MRSLLFAAAWLPWMATAAADLALEKEFTPPVLDFRSCEKPVWPKAALRKEQTGTVTLRFLIDRDGQVTDSMVAASSGYPLLDTAAEYGIRKCRFKPAEWQGRKLPRWANVKYVWSLESRPDAARYQELQAKAVQGDGTAMWELYGMLQYRAGFDDLKRNLLLGAAQRDVAEAQLEYGRQSVAQARTETERQAGALWIRKAADAGLAAAQLEAGIAQTSKRLTPAPDQAEAEQYLRKAAEAGLARATTTLGNLAAGDPDKPHDWAAAARWYRRAEAAGDGEAAYRLARMAEEGQGQDADWAQALREYQLAAQRDVPAAQYRLARAMLDGTHGMPNRPEEVRQLLEKAALRGNPGAQWDLSHMLFAGSGGPADPAAGLLWLRRAAASEHKQAMLSLARKYAHGDGMPADREQARDWYQLASIFGVAEAAAELAALEAHKPQ